MGRLSITFVAAALAGLTWSCVTARAPARPLVSTAEAPHPPLDMRAETCARICGRVDTCATQDARIPQRVSDACAAGCEGLEGSPTPLESRIFDCASLDDCRGFEVCTLAVFQPEASRSCAATCGALGDCRGQASPACVRDCETHRASKGSPTLPPARPCSATSTCDALEGCMVRWRGADNARTRIASPPAEPAAPSACHELCTRSVLCAGEAAQLAATEAARVVALMDQGLVSCVLDCEANVGDDAEKSVRACARAATCEAFKECANRF